MITATYKWLRNTTVSEIFSSNTLIFFVIFFFTHSCSRLIFYSKLISILLFTWLSSSYYLFDHFSYLSWSHCPCIFSSLRHVRHIMIRHFTSSTCKLISLSHLFFCLFLCPSVRVLISLTSAVSGMCWTTTLISTSNIFHYVSHIWSFTITYLSHSYYLYITPILLVR